MQPGPGQYDCSQNGNIKVQQPQGMSLNYKKGTPAAIANVLNPPSIPSHLSVFGYEENPSG